MKPRPFLALVPVVAIVAFNACNRHHAPPPAEALPTISVRSVTVQPKVVTAMEDTVGTVQPKLRASISSKVSGSIEKVDAVPGQTVRAGEILLTLDAREIQARFDQSTAMRQQAENDVKRYEKLRDGGVISAKEYDDAATRLTTARAAETEAKTMLDYVRIPAPFDGVITRKLADVGDLAQPGRPLMEIENPRELRIEANVPEALVAGLKLGDRLRVRIATADADLDGVVSEIAPSAQGLSRTFLVKLDLPPRDGLRSGQFGRVSIPVSQSEVLTVPDIAVIRRGQMEYVFTVEDGAARLRIVKTGKSINGEVQIISGIAAGDVVVTEGAATVTDGQPVTLQP